MNPDHPAVKFGKTGLLLVNLGTPDSTNWFDIRKYLKEFGITDFKLIDSQGATEGLIKNEAAEVVIDISSTGQTFKSNKL